MYAELCVNIRILVLLTMSLREQTKVPSHFLVHFDDNSWLVVSKSKIQYDGVPVVGQSYSVQYGNSRYEAENAKIVCAGEWVDMRKEMNIRKTATAPTVNQQPEVEQPPAKKQKKANNVVSKLCIVLKIYVVPV